MDVEQYVRQEYAVDSQPFLVMLTDGRSLELGASFPESMKADGRARLEMLRNVDPARLGRGGPFGRGGAFRQPGGDGSPDSRGPRPYSADQPRLGPPPGARPDSDPRPPFNGPRSPFEGMGAAREVTFACLAEPAFFFGLLVLARLSDSLTLASMLGNSLAPHWLNEGASLALVLLSWIVVLLVENCRIPFDDPNTHLELTMVHEVMVLDHSGPAFGMILYGASLKLFLFGAMIVRLVMPLTTGSEWLDWPIFIAGILAVAGGIGVVESTMARLRLPYIPVLLVAACLLSAFGILLLIR